MKILISTWLGLILLACSLMVWNSSIPGDIGQPPTKWILNPFIPYNQTYPTLIMVLHSYCPCSRASVAELQRIMTAVDNKIVAYVIVLGLPGIAARIDLSALASYPSIKVIHDSNGQLTRKLGVATSGHTLLYNQKGKLVFSGGITPYRGHEGGNDGENTIIKLATSTYKTRQTALHPVFGCPLYSKSLPGGTNAS